MNPDEFQAIVDQTVLELPKEFSSQLENVQILVEPWPTIDDYQANGLNPRALLFGVYRGVPKTKRTTSYFALPDRIIIFAGPILLVSNDLDHAKEKIKETVLHEIGHHFGLSDAQIYKAQRRQPT